MASGSSGIVFLISAAVAAISRLTRPPDVGRVRQMLWQPGLVALPGAETRDGYPWWKRVSFWFGAVASGFIIIYIIFW